MRHSRGTSPTTWHVLPGGNGKRYRHQPVHAILQGVALARQAMQSGQTPVVLADHSDRSGYATWLLREIIAQGLVNTLTTPSRTA